jgi:hypothetical protein
VCDDHGVCLGLVYSNELVSNSLILSLYYTYHMSYILLHFYTIMLYSNLLSCHLHPPSHLPYSYPSLFPPSFFFLLFLFLSIYFIQLPRISFHLLYSYMYSNSYSYSYSFPSSSPAHLHFHFPRLLRVYAVLCLRGGASTGAGAGEGCGGKETPQACIRYSSIHHPLNPLPLSEFLLNFYFPYLLFSSLLSLTSSILFLNSIFFDYFNSVLYHFFYSFSQPLKLHSN